MSPEEYLEHLLKLPELRSAKVSPDGKWVAWSWFQIGPAADVYLAPTDGTTAPIQLSNTSEDTMVVAWTPDSTALLVEQDQGGDERAQLFRIDLVNPGVLHPLTEASPNYFRRGGQLHPDGRWLVYGANIDVATGKEIEPTWVYRHDLMTGERVPLACPEKGGFNIPLLSSSGTHILYHRRGLQPGGYQVWMVDIEGQEDREILNFGPTAKAFARWLPDSQRVVFLAEAETHRRLGVWHLIDDSISWLVDDASRNLEDIVVPHGIAEPIVVVTEIRDARVRASILNVDTGIETSIVPPSGDLRPLRPLDDGRWVGLYSSSTQPTDVVRFVPGDLQPETFVSLTRVWDRTPIRSEHLTPAQDFRWSSVDGLEIQGWLYQVADPKGTIVYVHGGPTAHSEDRLMPAIPFFNAQDFNVFVPNYRGSTGFGLAFREAIKEDGWGGREQADIRTGIEALIDAGYASPGRVGVTGTSYGGYSSWCAITHCPPEIVAAAAPVCGMTDLVVDYETTRPDLRPYSEEMMGGRPDQQPERYYERSPINFVSNIKGYLLIVQGMRDPNVSPENVNVVVQELQKANVEYQLLAFEDEGHGIYLPKNQRVLYERLATFFAEAFA